MYRKNALTQPLIKKCKMLGTESEAQSNNRLLGSPWENMVHFLGLMVIIYPETQTVNKYTTAQSRTCLQQPNCMYIVACKVDDVQLVVCSRTCSLSGERKVYLHVLTSKNSFLFGSWASWFGSKGGQTRDTRSKEARSRANRRLENAMHTLHPKPETVESLESGGC